MIDGDRVLVSRFRAAELLVVEGDGQVSARLGPPPIVLEAAIAFSPAVAWRTVAAPGGGAIMVFQEEQTTDVQIRPGGYGGCGVVRASVSLLRVGGAGWTVTNLRSVLPVDVAVAPNGSVVNVARGAASEGPGLEPRIASVVPPSMDGGPPPILALSCGGLTPPSPETDLAFNPQISGQVVAIALDPSGRLLVQTREPALVVGDHVVTLPGNGIEDTGHELFHLGTEGAIACASCHPEGREDGHVWAFAGLGLRRTQSLGGGTLGTGPFHWSGDMKDFAMLAQEVFNKRMLGPALQSEHVRALADWINNIPAWKPTVPTDAAAAERGRVLFADPTVGCATCHAGSPMTNRAIVDVGTGAAFKVPSLLGVGFRAPYLHDGCAKALAERFGACGGNDMHGHVSSLTDNQRADLVAYLGTL